MKTTFLLFCLFVRLLFPMKSEARLGDSLAESSPSSLREGRLQGWKLSLVRVGVTCVGGSELVPKSSLGGLTSWRNSRGQHSGHRLCTASFTTCQVQQPALEPRVPPGRGSQPPVLVRVLLRPCPRWWYKSLTPSDNGQAFSNTVLLYSGSQKATLIITKSLLP